MDPEEQKRQLLGSNTTPVPTVTSSWVETYGTVEKVDHVVGECAIALVLGEDLTKNATSFGELSSNAGNTWLCFWILVLSVEDTALGSLFFDVSKTENPGIYWRAVEAVARRRLGIEKPFDSKTIDKFVKHDFMLNKEHLRDLQAAYDRIREEENKKKEKASAPKKAKKDEEEVVVEEEPAVAVVPRVLNMEVEILRDYIYEDSASLGNVQINEPIPIPGGGGEVMSKVTFVVSTIYNVRKEVVGYLIRFLIHDKSWNPGITIHKLIDECHLRELNAGNERFIDPRPQYLHLQGTNFPTCKMTWARWLSCINDGNGERPTFDTHVIQKGKLNRADEQSSPMHPKAICSLRRALKKLEAAGGLTGGNDAYYEADGVAVWPKGTKPVRYLSEQVFWDSDKKVGLKSQYFPFAIANTDELFSPELIAYLKNTTVYRKDDIRGLMPTFTGFRTGNMLVHMGADAEKYFDRTSKAFPSNYYETFKLYKEGVVPRSWDDIRTYQSMVKHYSEIWMNKFCSLMQLEGSPTYLPIPPSLRAMIKWFQEDSKGVFVTKVRINDPDLDIFSNFIARQLGQYEKFGKIIRTIIPMKLRGLFSVYMYREGQLLWNMCLYGDHGIGKSFITNGFMLKNCIPGTFKVIDRNTGAADQTDQHVDDEIRGQHEMEEAFINEKVGNKNPDKVNLKKAAMTSGVITVKTFEIQTVTGVGKLRAAREVVQSQNFTEVTNSNTQPSDNAIGSRYHGVLLGESDVPTEQMDYQVDTESKKTLQREFREMQFLSCWINKAMSVFAIPCRKPFMTLFSDISARMLETARSWGVISERSSVRALEIMMAMAWELTVERAALLTFHTPGGPHYGKKFHPKMLRDAAPYLYCDSNITLLTWTLHSSDWIKSDYGNVLKAAWRVATNSEWDQAKTLYSYYQQDTTNSIHFKTNKNYAHSREEHGNFNKEIVDLNFIELRGDKKELYRSIADRTNPPLTASDVEGVLDALSKRSYRPRYGKNARNGYVRTILCDDLKKHRGVLTPKSKLTMAGFKRVLTELSREMYDTLFKELAPEAETFEMAKSFVVGTPEEIVCRYLKDRTQPPSVVEIRRIVGSFVDLNLSYITDEIDPITLVHQLTLDDVYVIRYFMSRGMIRERGDVVHTYLKLSVLRDPMSIEFPRYVSENEINMINNVPISKLDQLEKPAMLSIADVSAKNRVCFCPVAIELFDKEIILDLFTEATLCSTMSAGKRLLGWVDDRDVSKLRTVIYSREMIDEHVRLYDDNAPRGAMLRANGVVFKRRQHVEESMCSLLFDDNDAVAKKEPFIVIDNLDRWAAEQQHLLCGQGFDDPVRDPEYIRRQYGAAGGVVKNVSYPEDIIRERISQSRKNWEPNAATKNSRTFVKLSQ